MKIAVSALFLSLLCTALPTLAADEGSAALEAIGQINGTALACKPAGTGQPGAQFGRNHGAQDPRQW